MHAAPLQPVTAPTAIAALHAVAPAQAPPAAKKNGCHQHVTAVFCIATAFTVYVFLYSLHCLKVPEQPARRAVNGRTLLQTCSHNNARWGIRSLCF